jgi:predicted MFS family arabinose efflux permease
VAHWAFYHAQQATLVAKAGVAAAPIALSLNASFMYLGFSLGAALGSMTIHYSALANLGFVSALAAAGALALAYSAGRRPAAQSQPL